MPSRRAIHGPYGAAHAGIEPRPAPRPVPEVVSGVGRQAIEGVRVLVVSPVRSTRDRLVALLAASGARCLHTDDAEELPEFLAAHRFDVVMLSDQIAGASAAALLTDRPRETAAPPSVVIVSEQPTLEQALAAMRAGAADLIASRPSVDELLACVAGAAEKSRARRAEARRVRRLRRLCKRLNSARREVVGQIESLCDDMAGAYERMSDQMTRVAISSEFNSLVRQDLDVEGLLRTVLEYALARLGPTNAAIFLPSSSGEHTLGAYVNYDVPKDAAEVLLDHLTTVVPHRFEDVEAPAHFVGDGAMERALGEDAHWLEGRGLVVMACRKDGETLAVAAFFRDAAVPFTRAHLESCEIIADLFGQQLGRVIHVHHRHLPMDEWGLPGDPTSR